MRIGYGYKRRDKDFDGWDCEKVFVDTPATMREERRALFLALEPGDTLFMFKPGDLGYGRELKALREILADNNVSIEYPPQPTDGRGRPAQFDPEPADDQYIRTMWKDQTFSQAYVLRVASERTGKEVKRHQLVYRYGDRKK